MRLVECAHGIDRSDDAAGLLVDDAVRGADRSQEYVALRAAAQREPAAPLRVPRQRPLALQVVHQGEEPAVHLAVARLLEGELGPAA